MRVKERNSERRLNRKEGYQHQHTSSGHEHANGVETHRADADQHQHGSNWTEGKQDGDGTANCEVSDPGNDESTRDRQINYKRLRETETDRERESESERESARARKKIHNVLRKSVFQKH